jgi:hypothetical protein
MKSPWSKLPSHWVHRHTLRTLRPHGASGSAAALKLYMALAMFANFKPAPTAPVAGITRLSFSELEALCDMSRRYVSLGLGVLQHAGLITIEPIGNAQRYLLRGYEHPGWAKLPRGHLLEEQRFKVMGIRGALYLNALKLYLALLAFRDNNSRETLLSYEKIEEYTGITRPHIRRAIDVLINHEWISMGSRLPADRDQRPTNVYVLRGDFWGRMPSTYARAATGGAAPSAA